ncbi:MAG: LuxR family transcriptional regulator [Alphaproteobacteria bacterium]|nr:MAG: LuxR family transcriptional regulator [Alphaproteobacteria bacterium]
MTTLEPPKGRLDRLTQSERECLRMVAQHMRSKEIARERGTSPYTVNRQIENAIRKLGAVDRHDAARIWLLEKADDGIPNGSSYDALGMAISPASVSFEGATEAKRDDEPEHPPRRDDQLYLEAVGNAAEGSGREPRTGLDGATPGIGPGQAVPLPGRGAVAGRDHEDGRLRGGSRLHEILSGRRSLSPRSWIIIFALSAFLGAILLAGVLAAVNASFRLVAEITHV